MNRLSRQLGIGLLALTLIVLVGCGDETVGSAPGNFTLTASSDGLSVILSWTEPADGQPDNYIVYFMEVNTTDWVVEATLDGNVLSFTHDPSGMTGDYYVAADFGGDEYDSPTMTTIPVNTSAVSVSELHAAGNSGYGWELTDPYTGSTYSMTNAANAPLVDWYVTDFLPGTGTQDWAIASPDLARASGDSTVVPAGSWRTNWFSDPITDPQAVLPNYGATTYFNYTEGIETDPTYIAVYLGDEENFALVRFSGVNTGNGTIQAATWFQTVPGLRLIAH